MAQNRVCKACLLRDLADVDMSMIEKYKDAIKPVDRVAPEEYEGRLQVCKTCDKLNSATCLACGCYVEIRAIAKASRCPKKYW